MKQKLMKLLGCSYVCYPIFISLFYFVVAVIWIFTTDSALHTMLGSYSEYRYFETAKSIFFVAFSAIIIFFLILLNNKKLKSSIAKQSAAKHDIASIFDATLDKIAIISKDGKIVGYNKSFLQTWPFDVLDDTIFLDGIFHEDKSAMEAEIQKVFQDGNAVDFENRFLDEDGKCAWHSWRIARSGDGSKVYLVGRNINRQKASQKVLEQEKESCLWLLDNMPLPIWKTDTEGEVEYMNREWYDFTATQEKAQLGDKWVESIHEEDASACFDSFLQAVKNRQNWQCEYRLRHKDGTYHWVCDSGKPLYSQNGNYIGYTGALYDIQKRKKAEAELIQKEELLIIQSRFAAMGEMISMIAHQWRQPITVIGMSANNMLIDMELEETNTEKFKTHLKGIGEQVQYLSKTIDDFRNFFKPNRQKETVSAGDLAEKGLKMVLKSFENNNIAATFEDFSKNTLIDAYSGELLQALISILNNAKDVLVDRKIEKPSVSVKLLKESEEFLKIEIQDNGGGVDTAIIGKIFDPYFTTKNEKSGTGLGLYMAKIIIEKHHAGTVSIQNTENGALFCILIPIHRGE